MFRKTRATAALLVLMVACSRDTSTRDTDDDTAKDTVAAPENVPTLTGSAGAPRTGAQRVTLSEAAFANAAIEATTVGMPAVVTGRGQLEVPAMVAIDPARVAIVSSRAQGRLESVAVVPGQRVSGGQAVAVLTSPTFLTAESDYVQARSRVQALQGTSDEAGARALLAAAADRLRLLGASNGDVDRLDAGGRPTFQLMVRAPFAGSVLEVLALAGSAVEAGSAILRIADLSVVDIIAQVPQQAVGEVHAGQAASVAVAAYPGDRFSGRVVRLQDVVDTSTRTIGAVIRVANTAYRLKPGMFATARLAVPTPRAPLNSDETGVTVPATAVITDAGRQYVFVEVGVRTFERRAVTAESLTPVGSASSTSSLVSIRGGIRPGERIVVRGALMLQSQLAKARLRDDE